MNQLVVLFLHFLIASISTYGFALFMQTPKKHILYASVAGGFGWVFYTILTDLHLTTVMASFFAACLVGIFGETFARTLKAPSIVFIMPGMLPLVPGRGLYYTMESLILREYIPAISHGSTTIAIAGAISLGIILVTSFARTIAIENSKIKLNKQKENATKLAKQG